jgi:hypothetical protein
MNWVLSTLVDELRTPRLKKDWRTIHAAREYAWILAQTFLILLIQEVPICTKKAVPQHTYRGAGETGVWLLLILDLGTIWG